MYYNPVLKTPRRAAKLRIGIVDDHILLRDALIDVINDYHDCEVTLRAANGLEMIGQVRHGNIPDIIILDLNMPFMDGYETAKWLVENNPAINILVLSMFDSEITIIRLLRTGVKAFLKKDTHPGELKHAIKSVMAEGYYYPQTISGKLANVFHNPDKSVFTQPLVLNENEIKFLKLSCSELTYKEMAKELFVSPRTVDNYRDQLFEKLDVKSRVGLAMYAIKNGIINF
ncbi:MAG: response regulator transcription factor [Saprospiraceae bacterium]|nr:response regulator transcription factor [Saprospiraceae bacterium]